VLSFFKKTKLFEKSPITTDMHSHLLAGIDDGVKNWDEAVAIIKGFIEMGLSKIITTPHIMSDTYRNDPHIISEKLNELLDHLKEKKIKIIIEAAAEYYLDEVLYDQLLNKEHLLTFGQRYLLFETNFISEPFQLKEFIFQASSQGYRVVLAHPERYGFMTMAKAEDLKNRGVYFQLNSLSITGYYSKQIQKLAQQLIEKGWVDFLGSDCHNLVQAKLLKEAFANKYYQKALSLPLLNNSL
jgi:protein-tyrosine phosphatase